MPPPSNPGRSRTAEKRTNLVRPEALAPNGSLLAAAGSRLSLIRNDWFVAGAVAVVTVVAFAPALRCGFLNFDDNYYVTTNTAVLNGLSWKSIAWAFTTFYQANWHPLAWLSLELDGTLWGNNPLGYHLTNVLLHAASAGLLFLALRALTGAFGRSLAVALLFAVHPLRAESVAWVSERKDVLSIFFGILALRVYASYVRGPALGRYIWIVVLFALSLLSKPTLVTLPFLLLVLDWWPLCRWRAQGKWPLVREKMPLFALTAASCVMSVVSQAALGAVLSKETIPLGIRLGNAVVAYYAYMAKTIWPSRLAPLYPHPALMPTGLDSAELLLAALVLIAATAGAIALRRRAPYLLAGWLWYLGTLVPVLGLVQVGGQAYADRYSYFPQVGLLLAACWGVADLLHARPRAALLSAAAATVLLAGLNWKQISYWHDSITLWEHDIEIVGESHIALFNCGDALREQNRLQEAAARFRSAIVWNSTSVEAHFQLGRVLQSLDQLDEAQRQFEIVADMEPERADAHNRLGDLYFRQRKLDESARQYESLLQIDPNDSRTLCNLGMVEMARNHLDSAARYYRQALESTPDSPEAHNGLGLILTRQGKVDEAIEELRTVIRIGVRAGQAHNNLGKALEDKGDFAAATEHYEQAAQLNPELGIVWFNLGRMRDRQKREAEALNCFEKALKCEPSSFQFRATLVRALDTLAARQATAGRFEEAISAAKRARDLAAAGGNQELARQIGDRLQHYERGESISLPLHP